MSRLKQNFSTTVSLAPLADQYGELWKKAYIVIAPLTVKALPKLRSLNIKDGATDLEDLENDDIEKVVAMVKASFESGKVVLNDELVEAEADDLDDLPMSVMNDIITASTGKIDPKS